MKENNKKKIWKITANSITELKPLYIEADTFDKALAIARNVDIRYNTGQLQ